jgi:hypothetical protein
MFLADHRRERCANGATTFFATHPGGVKKIVADTMDPAYFEVDLEPCGTR